MKFQFWLQQSCKPDRLVTWLCSGWLIVTFEWRLVVQLLAFVLLCCRIIDTRMIIHYEESFFCFDVSTAHQSTDTCCLLAICLCYSDYPYHSVTASLTIYFQCVNSYGIWVMIGRRCYSVTCTDLLCYQCSLFVDFSLYFVLVLLQTCVYNLHWWIFRLCESLQVVRGNVVVLIFKPFADLECTCNKTY